MLPNDPGGKTGKASPKAGSCGAWSVRGSPSRSRECIARSSIRNRKRLFHRNLRQADKSLFGVGAKLGFADLARLRHREGVDEDHMARDLEARDLAAAAGDHLVDVNDGAGRALERCRVGTLSRLAPPCRFYGS